jgi:hypothetical protein
MNRKKAPNAPAGSSLVSARISTLYEKPSRPSKAAGRAWTAA